MTPSNAQHAQPRASTSTSLHTVAAADTPEALAAAPAAYVYLKPHADNVGTASIVGPGAANTDEAIPLDAGWNGPFYVSDASALGVSSDQAGDRVHVLTVS